MKKNTKFTKFFFLGGGGGGGGSQEDILTDSLLLFSYTFNESVQLHFQFQLLIIHYKIKSCVC